MKKVVTRTIPSDKWVTEDLCIPTHGLAKCHSTSPLRTRYKSNRDVR